MSVLACLWSVLVGLTFTEVRGADGPVRFEASHDAMGTVFTVATYGRESQDPAAVVGEVFEEIDRLDVQMSNYKPSSELSGINRTAAEQAVMVEPGLFRLIEESVRYSRKTDGAFDITVGPLMKLWGFFRGQGRLPSDAEIAEVRKQTGFEHLRLDPVARLIRFAVRGVELDLGGIAKGYAVDRAVEILRANGIQSGLVSAGKSTIAALGAPPGERAWKVTLRDPFNAEKPADIFYLKNYSLSTSGNYEKFFVHRGKIYSHILDPRTGRPAENMLSSAVAAPLATESDAISTAFFVLGTEGARKFLARHSDLVVVLYQPSGNGKAFKRVVLRSKTNTARTDFLVEIAE